MIEAEVVAKFMMEPSPPVGRVPRREINDDAKAVHVGNHSRDGNEHALAGIEFRRVGQRPTGEEYEQVSRIGD